MIVEYVALGSIGSHHASCLHLSCFFAQARRETNEAEMWLGLDGLTELRLPMSCMDCMDMDACSIVYIWSNNVLD